MNLLTQLVPEPARQESQVEPDAHAKKRRGRWHRKPSRAEREQNEQRLADEVKARLAAWDRQLAQEQTELLAKSASLPDGIKVVETTRQQESGQEEGQSR